MNKLLITILLISSLLMSACSQISEEQAVSITKVFVDNNVKFYVNQGEDAPVVDHAQVTITNTLKKDNKWNIYLNIRSNYTGELKQSDILVIVDAGKGTVLDMRKMN